MCSADAPETYKFVITFRREPREIAGAPARWRGWVMRVETTWPPGTARRLWFSRLAQLPDAIRRLIEEAGGDPPVTGGSDGV